MLDPADRASLAPPPGRSSTAWTKVPAGMLRIGRLLPGLMSALAPDSTTSLRQSLWRNDVALLTVNVVQQRDVRGAVRVVLDVGDLGVDTVFVVAAEVDHAVSALVPPALVTGGDAAVRVSAAMTVQRAHQRLLRFR